MWVVGVDGKIIVIDAAAFRETSVTDLDELDRIIGSTVIEDAADTDS